MDEVMRLNIILNLYALKIKVFFGAFRASKASIALLFVYVLGLLPSIMGLSLSIVNAVKQGYGDAGLYVDVLAAVTSAIMAAAILLSIRGVTAFEYEQNIVFTSPLYPREFLVASFLANLTFLLIFVFPLIFLYVSLILLLNLPLTLAALIFLSSFIFVVSTIFLKTFFSLVKALYDRVWVSALMIIIVLVLMLPIIGIFTPSPLRYNALPYPSTLFARILVDVILHRSFVFSDVLGLLLFLIVSLIFFASVSDRNFFPLTVQIPLISPFDVSARAQVSKMESNIRLFSRMNLPLSLNLESKSLLNFLIRKEVIRIMREGSLFTIILIYAILSIIFTVTSSPFISGSPSLLIILSTYSIIISVMLAGNWRILEAKNLWLPLSSGADIRPIIRATLYAFIIVSLSVPLAIIFPISIFYRVNPMPALIILVPTSLIGCSINLYVAVKFLKEGRKGIFSILVGWLSMLLSLLLLAPVYILAALPMLISLSVALSAISLLGALVYSIIIMKIFLKLTEKSIKFIEV
ncbi:MAG: hypothetical protein QXV75_05140 [Candidatus Bathyarchaeia archaeon]